MKPSSLLEQIGPVPILPLLTPDEERELGERVAAVSSPAVEKLVEHNMLYAVEITLERYGRYGGDLDAIWSGALGVLFRAVHKFDHTLGFRFLTCADHWIREGIQRAIYTTGPPIHIPVYVREMLARISKKLPPVTWTPNARESRHYRRVIAKALIVKRPFLRDQEGPNDTLRTSAFRAIPASDSDPAAPLIDAEMIDRLRDEIDRLPDRDREILYLRYGIGCEPDASVTIAKRYGISREWVGKIEKNALRRLREILNRQFQEKSA